MVKTLEEWLNRLPVEYSKEVTDSLKAHCIGRTYTFEALMFTSYDSLREAVECNYDISVDRIKWENVIYTVDMMHTKNRPILLSYMVTNHEPKIKPVEQQIYECEVALIESINMDSEAGYLRAAKYRDMLIELNAKMVTND